MNTDLFRTEMLQEPAEIARWAEIVGNVNTASSYLEIGSKFGGSLWRVANAMPTGSLIVAVDLPNGTRAWRASEISLQACIAALKDRGYDAYLVWGNSTDPEVIARVRKFGPFRAALIDANHTRSYVERDWANYGPMAEIVAFHDIAWRRAPDWVGTRIDVPEFWNEVKTGYRHEEIRFGGDGKNNGIGVLWR